MKVRIEVTTTSTYEIDEAVLWPYGESNPTAAKAKHELTDDLGNGCSVGYWIIHELLDETWPVLKVVPDRIVAVELDRPNPAYTGDDVLFGDPPARTLVDRSKL